MNQRYAFVFAHYNARGLLDLSTRGLIDCLREAGRVVLVSTSLTDEQASSVHTDVRVIVRENKGYDFYSYKIGLESIEDLGSYDWVFMINSSFVCLEPCKLTSCYIGGLDGSADVRGLTFSREISPHLQSYFMSFSRKTFMSNPFRKWWDNLEPVSDRQTVIVRYELGLSTFLLANEFTLASAYKPSPIAQYHALCHATRLGLYQPKFLPFAEMLMNLQRAQELNPTHFTWQELLHQFGIVKRELIEKNPFHLDLTDLYEDHGQCLARLST